MSTLFVGLGRMGAPMSRRLAAGHEVVLLDADHDAAAGLAGELGCRSITGAADLPAGVDTVVLMLPDSDVVEAVLERDGLLDRLPPGSLVIDMGSSVPSRTQRLADLARERGVGYVDAPVSGGVAKAVTGELAIMVGGAEDDVRRALPTLEPLGGTVLRVGGPGAGHAAKALNNLASASNLAAAAEVLSVATSFGIAPERMVEVLNASTGASQASQVKYPKHVLTGGFDSGFALDLMLKDLGIALDLAREHGSTTPVTEAARASAVRAREALGPDGADHTHLAHWYETVNDVSLRATTTSHPQEEQS